MVGSRFPALIVRQSDGDAAQAAIEWLSNDDLPAGEVLVDVEWSSLNYKDALASRGHRGVVKTLPHVPGIDCAGRVAACDSDKFAVGDEVVVTGCGLGSAAWGGYAGRVRVPESWPVPLPAELTAERAMRLGTAGFTAAQCVDALLHHGAEPSRGPLLVTGATGGVGVWSVAILAELGFEVIAMSGKPDWQDALLGLGAARVVGREALASASDKPLLGADFAGGVDTVGGAPLSALVRSTRHRGCVACCGLVAGVDLPLNVYPFILRGVTVAGVDSEKCPREPRLRMWKNLAGPWRIDLPEEWITRVDLDGLPAQIEKMFAGQSVGRTIVQPKTAAALPA
ncbi:MAG: YhdH/YhfP family quinone oxidoreductase [Planctomycetota bacterium]